VDSTGGVYITDGSARVRRVYANGLIATVGGNGTLGYSGDGGASTAATLNGPAALAVASNGGVYVADSNNNAVRLLLPLGAGISIAAVAHNATNLSGALAPGEVVVLYGSGLGPDTLTIAQLDVNGVLPTSVGGTTVYFGSILAPLLYASPGQVGAIVPFGTGGSQVQILAYYNGRYSAPFTASVATAVPGVYTRDGSGTGQVLAWNQDGSVNTASSPAKAGSIISLYVTGAGQTTPAGVDGLQALDTTYRPILPVTATIGGASAAVQYAGSARGLVSGVIQVNLTVPSGVTAGSAPLVLQVGSNSTQPGLTVAVSN